MKKILGLLAALVLVATAAAQTATMTVQSSTMPFSRVVNENLRILQLSNLTLDEYRDIHARLGAFISELEAQADDQRVVYAQNLAQLSALTQARSDLRTIYDDIREGRNFQGVAINVDDVIAYLRRSQVNEDLYGQLTTIGQRLRDQDTQVVTAYDAYLAYLDETISARQQAAYETNRQRAYASARDRVNALRFDLARGVSSNWVAANLGYLRSDLGYVYSGLEGEELNAYLEVDQELAALEGAILAGSSDVSDAFSRITTRLGELSMMTF